MTIDVTYGTTVGALLAASWFAMLLSGFLLLQAYLYFRHRPKGDSVVNGVLVSQIFCPVTPESYPVHCF